jgi:RimJ/RimL family protein N-acetyltransferase
VRHDFSTRGVAFGLRPVRVDDAETLLQLRTHSARTRFLNRGGETVEAQRMWLNSYFDHADDYYFIVYSLSNGRADGALTLCNVDARTRSGEWGRWVVRPGSSAAVESAMLAYRIGFESLRLERIYSRTLAQNAHVISFHDSCGVARAPDEIVVQFEGKPAFAVEHHLDVSDWPAVEQRLDRLARRIATALKRSS